MLKHFKKVGIVAGVLLSAGVVFSGEHSLKSTPDKGTELDVMLANKVLKVAEYVVKRGREPPDYGKNPGAKPDGPTILIGYTDKVDMGDKTYFIMIHDSAGDAPDAVEMSCEYTQEDTHFGKYFFIADYGLDGRCNLGVANDGSGDPKIFIENWRGNSGLEHREFYQKRYVGWLDDLIEHYEPQKK